MFSFTSGIFRLYHNNWEELSSSIFNLEVEKMKNLAILAGKARNVRKNQYNGRDLVSFTASVADPARKREDGSPFTYSIPVSTSGPQATRLKEKLKDGAFVMCRRPFRAGKER